MVEIIVVVRELGKLTPEYSLTFDVPEVPSVGDYLSISGPDVREPLGQDLVVCKVWWRLWHPATGGGSREADPKGRLTEIFVECDTASGPYASEHWKQRVQSAHARNITIEEFRVSRMAAR